MGLGRAIMMKYFCCNIQIMSLLKQPDELTSKIKRRKAEMMQEQTEARQRITAYYQQLRQLVVKCEQQTLEALDSAILSYYEKSAEIIRTISKNNHQNSQEALDFARQFLDYSINAAPIVDCDKMASIISSAHQITINNKPQPKISEVLREIIQEPQAQTQSHDMSEVVIQKLQCERDYYQRREIELQQKIRELETGMAKRGVNIKEMSRSYLEEKCSKWALERLTEEKKILVDRIGEASQQIMRLNTEIADLQHELKKHTNNSDAASRSMVGNSTIKVASLVDETRNYQKILENEEARRDRQAELLQKNEQLMVELTRCMRQLQQLAEANSIMENRIETDQQKQAEMRQLIESLKQSNECLNHDYEISLKRKAAFEQESRQLKAELTKTNEILSEEREAYRNLIMQLEKSKLEVLEKVKEIQETRKAQVQKYQSKLKEVQNEKERLRTMVEEKMNQKGEEANYKALLNQQISRLLRQVNSLSQQLQLRQQKLFEQSDKNQKLTVQLKAWEGRAEQGKKQTSRLKKHGKDLQQQINELQRRLQNSQNLQIKLAFLQQNYHILLAQFNKCKENYDKKSYLHEKTISHLKDKFSLQLAAVLQDDNKHNKNHKKHGQKMEIIEKYIEEMLTLSSKTAQIKQMKEEIRELKENKEQSSSKKTRTNSVQQAVTSIQGGIMNLGAKIMDQRIQSQKEFFEESIKELQEIIAKEQVIKATLQQQLDAQRAALNQLKKSQKQEALTEQKSKQLKLKEQKIERLETQLKISRTNCRKLQNENTELESELKTKKQLASGLKKECKEKDEIIKQISAELSISQQELEKLRRNQREASKKETMFRDIKQRKQQVDEENSLLKRTIEGLQDKIKLLNKQLAKKDESLREVRNSEQRQLKVKQEGKLREAYETIASQKEIIRKLKMQVERKDDVIKNSRQKGQSKVKQLESKALSKERQSQKAKKELELFEKKIQTAKANYKKQQNRNYLLSILIKKLYELVIAGEQLERNSNHKESIHYYSATTLTPHQIKTTNRSASNLPKQNTSDICEGLRILDLKPEDLQGLLGQTTIGSKVSYINHENSWSMVSPIVHKSNEGMRQEQLMSGLQQLQRLLSQKQVNSTALLQVFKRAMRAQ